MGCVLPCRRKGWRAGHPHPHCQTRALASSSRRMPSHAFSPKAHAAPPSAVGLVHNPAAATSLSTVIAVTIGIRRVTQNNVIFSFRIIEESRMRMVLSCSYKHRRVGQAYRGC